MASIMVGIMSGLIGSFIILRGMSLMGDAISHSVLPGVAVACVASAPFPESGSVRPFNFQSTSFGTVSLAIPLERKQDSVSIRNGSSFPGWCLWKVVLLKRQSEIYPPGAAFANSFTISSMMSEDAGEAFLKSAFPFLLRGPEQKAASSLWHQCNLENWA